MAKKKKKTNLVVSSSSTEMWKLLALFVSTFFLYYPSLDNPLIYDSEHLQKNQFYSDLWSGFSLMSARWVTFSTFAGGFSLFGENLFFHRFINLLVHFGNVFLIYKILKTLFVKLRDDSADAYLAFWGAALFAVSPMAVFGVAYLVQRLILLSALFMLLSLYCFLKAISGDKWKWYLSSVLFFFLSVHAKEHSALMPMLLVAFLVAYKKLNKEYLAKNWYWLLIYVGVSIQIFMASSPELASVYEPHAKLIIATQEGALKESVYLLSVINQGYAFFKYLLLWLIPVPIWMAFELQFPLPSQVLSWPHLAGFIAFVLYFIMATVLLFKKGRKTLLGLGLICPAVLFLAEFTVTRYTENFVIYRSYLWMGLLFLILPFVFRKLNRRTAEALLLVLVTFSCLMMRHRLAPFETVVGVYEDSISKLTAKDDMVPGAYRLYDLLGYAHLQNGDVLAAEKPLQRSLELNGNYEFSNHNMGVFLEKRGDFERSMEYYLRALTLKHGGDESLIYKEEAGEISAHLGNGLIKLSKLSSAEPFFDRALTLNGKSVKALNGKALILAGKDDWNQAFALYERALQYDADASMVLMNYGEALYKQKRFKQSFRVLEHLIELEPENGRAYYQAGNALSHLNYSKQAVKMLLEAERLISFKAEINFNLGVNYLQLGQNELAKGHFKLALKKNPEYDKAKEALKVLEEPL